LVTGIVVSAIGVRTAPQPNTGAAISGRPVRIDAVAVPLNPRNPAQKTIGDFVYAGGLMLSSLQSKQLHGLSDIEVAGTDRLNAVGDMGILLEARLVFDRTGRLTGLTNARITALTGEDGKPLLRKSDADAEGLALFPNGDRLVSFERRDRIWLDPAGGGPPRPAPSPEVAFPSNGGMEGLGLDPDDGVDAYVRTPSAIDVGYGEPGPRLDLVSLRSC